MSEVKKHSEMEIYLVGGAVRDQMLGRTVSDRDWVVVGSTPEVLIRQGFQQVGSEFPCFLHPETKEEYALARSEKKTAAGHKGFISNFSPDVTLEEDLCRRDLTINAIAQSVDGQIIDPFAGSEDLKNGVLRHVSDAFVEDPLRVLRVARFAARYADLGFTVAPETMSLMTDITRSGELSHLTPERIWKEMFRALSEIEPSQFFRVLRECGALKVIMPELDRLFGIPQPPQHHPEVDTGEHVMMCLDIAKKYFNHPIVTWAVLVHDLGKGVTPETEWPKHIKHEIKGVPLVESISKRFKVPRDYADLGKLVTQYHLSCHKLLELRPRSILRLLEAVDAFRRPERLHYFAEACESDARGRLGMESRDYSNRQLLLGCASTAMKVDTKPLLDEGYRGIKLAEQIRRVRLQRIATYWRTAKG
jgi:tRNA nucleotidyltransferase (CCA-adding enzyme)